MARVIPIVLDGSRAVVFDGGVFGLVANVNGTLWPLQRPEAEF